MKRIVFFHIQSHLSCFEYQIKDILKYRIRFGRKKVRVSLFLSSLKSRDKIKLTDTFNIYYKSFMREFSDDTLMKVKHVRLINITYLFFILF